MLGCVRDALELDPVHRVGDGNVDHLQSLCLDVEDVEFTSVELHASGVSPAGKGEEIFMKKAVIISGGYRSA